MYNNQLLPFVIGLIPNVCYKCMLFVLQTVHEGKWRGKRVAVKMMKETAMSDEGFIEEAKTMT